MKKLLLIIAAATCMYCATAQPCTWLGNTSDWFTASNWCTGVVPTATTDVNIQPGTPNQPVINAAGAVCHSINISEGASLTVNGNNILSVSGDWTNNGTFNANSSTVSFSANTAVTQTITGNTTFFNVSKPNSNSTLSFGSSTSTIGNNLSVSGGSMSGGTSTIIFTGNSASLQGTSTKDFYNLEISNGAVLTQTAGTNVNINNSFKNNGTFIQSSNRTITFQTVSQTLSGSGVSTFGNMTVSGAITVNAGTHDFSVLGTFNVASASGTFNGGSAKITFAGLTAALGTGPGSINFNNITISGILSNANNKNFALSGSWINNGTYNPGNEAIIFNGGSQTIGGSVPTVFSSLSIAGTADKILENDITANNTLTLTGRNVDANANAKTVYARGTVIRNPSGHIIGNLKKDIPGGSIITKLFEVGTSAYSPVTIDFETVIAPGALTVRTDNGDDPHMGTSTLDANRSVNRYWTLTNDGIDAGNFDATFEFVAADVDAGVNTNNFQIGKYSTATWTYFATINVNATHVKGTGVLGFGEFVIAEIKCTPPSISDQPVALQNICQNETAMDLVVTATGEGLSYQWYVDNDNTGFDGNPVGSNSNSLTPPTNGAGISHYYCVVTGTCGIATSHYAAVEVTPVLTWYRDADGDAFGDALNSIQSCTAAEGYVADNTDCNDDDNTVYPGAAEICDGKDNNCNGAIDENGMASFYRDADGDGFGDLSNSIQSCTAPAGYVADNTDCNDDDNTVYPGAPELCDGKDNNCNGTTDESGMTTFYRDADGDGYGDPSVTVQACSASAGFVSNNGDCNDARATVYPGAPELCDGIDNNCNGEADETQGNTYYRDADGDGYGNPSISVNACTQPAGYVNNNSDCNDTNEKVHPGAGEICANGIDENCNGRADEGCITTVKVCTYNQTSYDNNNITCVPNGISTTAQIMLNAVHAQPGDSVVFGSKTSGRFFTLKKLDIQNGSIYKLLPARGGSKALIGYSTFTRSATWSNVPLSSGGAIQNELLAQTMTLFFNMQLSPTLSSLPLNTNLNIRKLAFCALEGNVIKVKFTVKASVAKCLETKYGTAAVTVGNLYKLANELLGNINTCNLNYADMNNAIKTVNELFNGCVILNMPASTGSSSQITTTAMPQENTGEITNEGKELTVSTSPNPFRDNVRFNIVSPETGKLKILIYDARGVKRGELEQSVTKNIPATIWFRNEQLMQGVLFYRVSINNKTATGKIIQMR